MQGWDVLYPTFQLADLGYHWHDAPIRRALRVNENELATMNAEFIWRSVKVVRRYIVCPVWIEFEQGSHFAFWGRVRDIGELEDGRSLRWVDDLYDCGTTPSVPLPKDVVAWP